MYSCVKANVNNIRVSATVFVLSSMCQNQLEECFQESHSGVVVSTFATQLILMIHAKRARTERKGNKEMLLESDESQTVQSALRAEALSRSI